MANENIHSIALQVSQAAQKYEQYMDKVEELHKQHEGTVKWIESLLGEMTDDMREMFGNITAAKEMYRQEILICRNTLLRISQKLIQLSEER